MFSSRAKKSPRRWSFNYESCFNVEFSFSLAAKEQIGQADVFLQIDSPEKGLAGRTILAPQRRCGLFLSLTQRMTCSTASPKMQL